MCKSYFERCIFIIFFLNNTSDTNAVHHGCENLISWLSGTSRMSKFQGRWFTTAATETNIQRFDGRTGNQCFLEESAFSPRLPRAHVYRIPTNGAAFHKRVERYQSSADVGGNGYLRCRFTATSLMIRPLRACCRTPLCEYMPSATVFELCDWNLCVCLRDWSPNPVSRKRWVVTWLCIIQCTGCTKRCVCLNNRNVTHIRLKIPSIHFIVRR
jgi:hypothetical protein